MESHEEFQSRVVAAPCILSLRKTLLLQQPKKENSFLSVYRRKS